MDGTTNTRFNFSAASAPRKPKTGVKRFAEPNGRLDAAQVTLALFNEQEPPAPGAVIQSTPTEFDLAAIMAQPLEPLGAKLGYVQLSINENNVWKKIQAVTGSRGRNATPQQIAPILFEAVLKAAKRHPQLADVPITKNDVFGKDGAFWVRTPNSVPFRMGKDYWRVRDIIGSNVQPGLRLNQADLKHVPKLALDDGPVAVVQGPLLGLPEDTLDFIQHRTLGYHKDGAVVRTFKGLLAIHPMAKNVIAWNDGYGELQELVEFLETFVMTWGTQANYRAKASFQSANYSGIDRYWRRFFSIPNLSVDTSNNDRRVEDKLIAADAPVEALGGFGMVSVNSNATKVGVPTGVNRILLSALVFKFIGGLEHIAELETRLSTETIPGYYAPESLREYYEAAGKNSPTGLPNRALERRPAKSSGECVMEHELLGFNPFNAFVINSESMLRSGADKDGDAVVDYALPEDGGVLIPFNRYPKWLQNFIDHFTGGQTRKEVVKRTYPTPLDRAAGQWSAKYLLGRSDVTATAFLYMTGGKSVRHQLLEIPDGSLDDLAIVEVLHKLEVDYGIDRTALTNFTRSLEMSPWVQAAVDNQKYVIEYPRKIEHFPELGLPEGVTTASHLIRRIMKGGTSGNPAEDDEAALDYYDELESLSAYDKAWKKMQSKQAAVQELYHRLTYAPHTIRVMDTSMSSILHIWAGMLDAKLTTLMRQLPMVRNGKPNPHSTDFPVRTPDETVELPQKIIDTVKYLDSNWMNFIYRSGGVFVDDSTRLGAFNLKDGLLDTAIALGKNEEVAKLISNFSLFREFASVKQLKQYFSGYQGERVSRHFPVQFDTRIIRTEKQLRALPMLSNELLLQAAQQQMSSLHVNRNEHYIGFMRFHANTVASWLNKKTNQFEVQIGGHYVKTPCSTRRDAISYALGVLFDRPDFQEQVRTLSQEVQAAQLSVRTIDPAQTRGDLTERLRKKHEADQMAEAQSLPLNIDREALKERIKALMNS